jgi:hypothetical protein
MKVGALPLSYRYQNKNRLFEAVTQAGVEAAWARFEQCSSRSLLHLPLLPSTPMPWCAAAGAGGGAEFGAGLARVGGLEDFAAAGRGRFVARGFARRRAVGAEGQGFGAVHFVEMGFVDF